MLSSNKALIRHVLYCGLQGVFPLAFVCLFIPTVADRSYNKGHPPFSLTSVNLLWHSVLVARADGGETAVDGLSSDTIFDKFPECRNAPPLGKWIIGNVLKDHDPCNLKV